MKALDRIILLRLKKNPRAINELAIRLKKEFSDPKLFQSSTSKLLGEWARNSAKDIAYTFGLLFRDIRDLECMKSSGHDYAYVIDNMHSALRIFEEYTNLSEAEKIEIALACFLHDVGRIAEKIFQKIDPRKLMYVFPAILLQAWSDERKNWFPKELVLRVLYDIASGFEPLTGKRTADIVHQCDREQLIGTAVIARGLGFDVGIQKRHIVIPGIDALQYRLPIPETTNDRYWLIQYEFYMRNLYPLVSPNGKKIAEKIKKENVVILALGCEGNKDVFKQVFAPELGRVRRRQLHWTKKAIPRRVFLEGVREAKRFLRKNKIRNLSSDVAYAQARALMRIEEVEIPTAFKTTLLAQLRKYTMRERQNFLSVLAYAKEKRHQSRLLGLRRMHRTKRGVAALIAQEIKNVLRRREARYKLYN